MWEGYSADGMLKDMDLSIEDVRNMRDSVRAHAEYIDPVPEWHDLIRIMRPDVLKKIQGPLHTAQFYYNIVRILTMFINDLEDNDEADTPFDVERVNRKKLLYGVSELDYREQGTRKGIIEYYTLGPTAQIVFVGGRR